MFGRHILGTDAQRVIRRMQWVVAQDVLDVCDQQLLMLLFMLHAQLYQGRDRGLQWFLQHTAHGLVHMRAIRHHLSHRRATQAPSLRACQVSALRFVVAVEQVAIQRMEQSIVRLLFREDKSLEEPRGVGQVPLRRTDVGNRLGNMVLGTQRGTQTFAARTDRDVSG